MILKNLRYYRIYGILTVIMVLQTKNIYYQDAQMEMNEATTGRRDDKYFPSSSEGRWSFIRRSNYFFTEEVISELILPVCRCDGRWIKHAQSLSWKMHGSIADLSINSLTLQWEFLEKKQFTALTSTALAPCRAFLSLLSLPIRRYRGFWIYSCILVLPSTVFSKVYLVERSD